MAMPLGKPGAHAGAYMAQKINQTKLIVPTCIVKGRGGGGRTRPIGRRKLTMESPLLYATNSLIFVMWD